MTLVDTDEEKLAEVMDGRMPFSEPGAEELLAEQLADDALDATTDFEGLDCDAYVVVGTPIDEHNNPQMDNLFIQKILIDKQNPMELFGDGEQVRCFTWIDEVAEAIATQSFADVTRNEAYNLANPEPITMKELARLIFEKGKERTLVDGERLEFDHVPIYEDDVKKRVPSVEKAENDFDWSPEMKVRNALERCIDNVLGESSVN